MKPIVTPEQSLSSRKISLNSSSGAVPEVCILVFTADFENLFLKEAQTHTKNTLGCHILEINKTPLAVKKCFIGPTAASISLEELITVGFKKFIAFGSAGALSENLKLGQVLLGQHAVCEEGVAQHYIQPSPDLISNQSAFFQEFKNHSSFDCVSAWTTCAPYRETVQQVKNKLKSNTTIVDMEMASLLAVAQSKKVELVNIFVISDHVLESGWKMGFKSSELQAGQKKAFKIIMDFLQK